MYEEDEISGFLLMKAKQVNIRIVMPGFIHIEPPPLSAIITFDGILFYSSSLWIDFLLLVFLFQITFDSVLGTSLTVTMDLRLDNLFHNHNPFSAFTNGIASSHLLRILQIQFPMMADSNSFSRFDSFHSTKQDSEVD